MIPCDIQAGKRFRKYLCPAPISKSYEMPRVFR